MKKASVFLKQIITLLSSMAKAKSLAIKSKTSVAKARLIMFSLVKNRKVLMDSVSTKIHSLLGHKESNEEDGDDQDGNRSKALVLYNEYLHSGPLRRYFHNDHQNDEEEEEDDDKYPDLRHSLFDEDENFDDVKDGGSVIDIVRNSKVEGEDFKLEDEIDQVADLFIHRFHKQMRLQKLLSFKRHQACSGETL